ncbi:hypothetical protein MLD38_012106 [Melastoma candidum]|uniref:Uncharacterized protein n=1 Tax=Melastoma candidum TaxID=119954 RepID=A0ACB9R6B0_9MYRT|nr:hypothetical protein MLD38_012106 [Melastoma candidum]
MAAAAAASLGWVDLSLISLRSSVYRCRDLLASSVVRVPIPRGISSWPAGGLSIVDEVVWKVVTAVESVALVSMLGFFYLFCGCTV